LALDFTASNEGLASFLIRPDAVPGVPESADLYVTYDLYTDDPSAGGTQVYPSNDAGFLQAPVSVSVTYPEPFLEVLNPALRGNAGERVGWNFRLFGDDQYWLVVTSVQSTFPDAGGYAADNPPVTDLLSGYFATSGLALPPGGLLQMDYDGVNSGLASYLIRSDPGYGAPDVGELFVTYDLYTDDPALGGQQVFPADDLGFFRVVASVGLHAVPEPASVVLMLSAAFLLLLFRWKPRLGLASGWLVLTTSAAFGQYCNVTSIPLALRPESSAELAGEITLYCSPGLGPVSLSVTLSAPLAPVGPGAPPTANGAIGNFNAVLPNFVYFHDVVPAADTGAIQIQGIRIAANQTTLMTAVMASLIMTYGPSVLPLNPNPTVVGYTLPSSGVLSVVDRAAAAAVPASGVTLRQCDGSNPALASSPTSGAPDGPSFHVRLKERFTMSFTTRADEGPGAQSGTRFRLLFENVPAGVEIFAGTYERGRSSAQSRIQMIDHDSSMTGTSSEALPILPPLNPAAGGLRPLRTHNGTTRIGVWEAVSTDSNNVDEIDIPIYVVIAPGTVFDSLPFQPKLTVSLAPVAPVPDSVFPRFSSAGTTVTPFRVDACGCPVTPLARLISKSGSLAARTWQVSIFNSGSSNSAPDTAVSFKISSQAGPGSAAIVGPAAFPNSPIAKGASRIFNLNLAFTGTTNASRFQLQGAVTGGCLKTSFTIQNQAP
jgi:hypothetical protein